MNGETLSAMSDAEVVQRLKDLLRDERRLTAAVLAHLAEVEARRLHLTAVVRLAPHLSEENAEALVAEASGKSKAEIDVLLARLAPRPDLPVRLEREGEQQVLVPEPPDAEVVPEPPRPASGTGRLAPIAPARFALQLTIGEETQQKLVRAQALLRHQVPSGEAPGGGAGRGALLVRRRGRAAVRGDRVPRARSRDAGVARRRTQRGGGAGSLPGAQPVRSGAHPRT